MHVLVIKTSSLGDVIHTLPALTDAAEAIPGIKFDWVVEESFAEVPRWHSRVETVIPVALRRWRKTPLATLCSQEWRDFKAQLGHSRYDAVIDAQGLVKSAWLTRYAKGMRFGLDKHSAREPLASLFYNRKLPIAKEQHAVERVRQLFAAALGYTVPQRTGDYQIDRTQLPDVDQQSNYLVFLHGTTWPTKHWPENYWRDLACIAAEQGLAIMLPWGNDIEKQRAERIAASAGNVKVLPRMSLGPLATVLAGARAVVSVDTGLAHLSAALDTSNITLYGPTKPALVGTYGNNQIHLEAKNYTLDNTGHSQVEPAIFAPLTPEVVWQNLSPLLRLETAK